MRLSIMNMQKGTVYCMPSLYGGGGGGFIWKKKCASYAISIINIQKGTVYCMSSLYGDGGFLWKNVPRMR